MSSAYKKALEKQRTAEVSLFDQDKGAVDSSSSSDNDEDGSDSEPVKKVPIKAVPSQVEDDENQLRAFRDQDAASKEWKNR